MGVFADMDREVTRMTNSVLVRRFEREDAAIQQLIDETLASGAMRRDFDLVLIYRRGCDMQPQLR